MAYIQSKRHFINYLNKALRNSDEVIDETQLLPGAFYLEQVYDRGLADEYTWALKCDGIGLLQEDKLWAWLSEPPKRPLFQAGHVFRHRVSEEFEARVWKLQDTSGVYGFWRDDETPLYVGRSVRNLGSRMGQSFEERFTNYDRPVYLRYIETPNGSDACILEMYFISKLKPLLNRRGNYDDAGCSFVIGDIPEWSERVLCSKVIRDGENGDQETGQEAIPDDA